MRVLFVCLGNICRSPMAEVLFNYKLNYCHRFSSILGKVTAESAGTGGYHNGEDMHKGTRKILSEKNIPIHAFKSSELFSSDADKYDYFIAMDDRNVADIRRILGKNFNKVIKITDLVDDLAIDHIPDPYFTGDFKQTFDLLDCCLDALLVKIETELTN